MFIKFRYKVAEWQATNKFKSIYYKNSQFSGSKLNNLVPVLCIIFLRIFLFIVIFMSQFAFLLSVQRFIMSGVSPAIQNWSINTSIMQLRSMMSRLTITDDYIRRYVVSPDEGLRMEDERSRRQRANEATNAKPAQPLVPPSTENNVNGNNIVHVTPANGPTVEVCVIVCAFT